MKRRISKTVYVDNIPIGGDSPIVIQSMTNKPLVNIDETLEQIEHLYDNGAQFVRVAVKDKNAAEALKNVVQQTKVPLVADIHFDYRLAIASIEAGVKKVRLNPGNIGGEERVKAVVDAASQNKIPIRIGVNGGSIDRKKYSAPTPEALIDSAQQHIHLLEDCHFEDIVVSIKSSDIFTTIEANRLFAEKYDYPLHIGLTEAGYGQDCIIQSSVALGHLLLGGIGDTIRVSMTGDPAEEPVIARKILEAAGVNSPVIKIVSCPTCGRTATDINLLEIAQNADALLNKKFYKRLKDNSQSIIVAVMGCEVNGPGEASDADCGLAGGHNGTMVLFNKGKLVKRVKIEEAVQALADQVEQLIK